MKNRFLENLFAFFVFLFFRVSSWLCSVPMWLTLILHFTIGLSIWWFWATLAVWLLAGVIRYSMIRFGRWGAKSIENNPPKQNKNPYSQSNADIFKGGEPQ